MKSNIFNIEIFIKSFNLVITNRLSILLWILLVQLLKENIRICI